MSLSSPQPPDCLLYYAQTTLLRLLPVLQTHTSTPTFWQANLWLLCAHDGTISDITLLLNSLHLNKLLNSQNFFQFEFFHPFSTIVHLVEGVVTTTRSPHTATHAKHHDCLHFLMEMAPVYSNIPSTLQTSHSMHKPNMIASLMQ